MAEEPVVATPQVDKTLEALVFNEPIPKVDTPPTEIATDAPPATPIVDAAPAQPADDVVDVDVFIKEKFGVENFEQLQSEWQKLKTAPKAEPVFANDESKKIALAINSGKLKEVKTYLEAQELLSGLDSLSDEQRLKLYIKMQNPLYDQELVDYQYDKDFKFNDAAFKDEDGNITDPLGLRFAKTQALQKAQTELARANDFFSTYKTKIELPIDTPQANVDEGYKEYQASTAQSQQAYNNIIVPSLNALTEADIPLSFKVEDTGNQMNFDVALAVDKADLDAAKKEAIDFPGYLERSFYDKDGKFLASKLTRAIALEKNFDKYAQSIARQAVNAERKRVIEKETPSNGQRRYENVDVSGIPEELKKLEPLIFPGN